MPPTQATQVNCLLALLQPSWPARSLGKGPQGKGQLNAAPESAGHSRVFGYGEHGLCSALLWSTLKDHGFGL